MKVGIIDVGGGMKGAFSSGLYDYLMDENIMITKGYGVSAGAANLVTYLSGQRGRTLRFYTIYPKRKEYMGISQFLKTGSFFNLKYVYRTLSYTGGVDAFDFDAYKSSEMEMEFIATNALTGKPVYYKMKDGGARDLEWMRASASMPVVSNAVQIDGYTLFDGGVSDSIPIRYFMSLGYERNIVVLTRPRGYRKKEKDISVFIKLALRKYPEMIKAMQNRSREYNECLDYLDSLEKDGKVLIIAPSMDLHVKRVEKDKTKVKAIYDLGLSDTRNKLEEIKDFLK